MNGELVTIIIPVYNVERFISECLDSVINQSYDNLEILMINDGSTDGSGRICEEYEKKDRRVRVIHQENKGLSSARNTGINNAKGSYITFLDSDDAIAPSYIEELYHTILRNSCDISVCDYIRFKESESITAVLDKVGELGNVSSYVFNNVDAIKQVYGRTYHGMQYIACGKLYRKTLFIDNEIRFPDGKIHEDTFTTYKVLFTANKICYIDSPLYLYREREGSIMNSNFSRKSLVKFDAIKEECEFFKEHNEDDLYAMSFFHLLFEKKNTIREMIYDETVGQGEIREFAKSLREDMKGYKGKTSVPLKKRIYYTALSYYPSLSKI